MIIKNHILVEDNQKYFDLNLDEAPPTYQNCIEEFKIFIDTVKKTCFYLQKEFHLNHEQFEVINKLARNPKKTIDFSLYENIEEIISGITNKIFPIEKHYDEISECISKENKFKPITKQKLKEKLFTIEGKNVALIIYDKEVGVLEQDLVPDIILELNKKTCECIYKNQSISLGSPAFKVLYLLAEQAPNVVPYSELHAITDKGYEKESYACDNLKKTISKLIKIFSKEIIKNTTKVGYKVNILQEKILFK